VTDSNLSDWHLLSQFSQVFRAVSDSFADQADMHRAQGVLLCILKERDGMTQSEIADQLSVQGATITNMLQRMEDSGLVTRRRDTADNRLVRVYLTDDGRAKEQAVHEQFVRLEATIFAGISGENRELLRQLLRQMVENMSVKI
jgi:MarR family transcriptional regulator, organic hydroperoxide resistance regulator